MICLPLAEALVSHGDLVAAHFMKQETRLGSAKFAAWHEASVTNGLFVHTGDNVEIEGTIEVHHWISGKNTVIFPHTLVVTGKSSKVRVIDIFRSEDDISPGLAIAFNDLCAGQNSQLDYVAIQALNEVTRIIQINETSASTPARHGRATSASRASKAPARAPTCFRSPSPHASRNTTNAPSNIMFPKEPTRICFIRTPFMTTPRRSSPD